MELYLSMIRAVCLFQIKFTHNNKQIDNLTKNAKNKSEYL